MTLRDRRTFSGLLADLREQRGLSQNKLGVEAGVDSTMVCKLENGTRAPSRATIAALATVLALDTTDTHCLYISAGLLPPGDWVACDGWLIRPASELTTKEKRRA